jgi:hypothetical protein
VRRPLLNGQFVFQTGHARPGLLAGRPLHRAHRLRRSPSTCRSTRTWASTWCASTSRSSRSAGSTTPTGWESLCGRTFRRPAQDVNATDAQQAQFEAEARENRRRAPQLARGRRVHRLQRGLGRAGARRHPSGGAERQEPGPDPAGERPQWIQLLPVAGQPRQRRPRRLAHVPGSGLAAAVGVAGSGAGRVRRARPAHAGPRVQPMRGVLRLRVAAQRHRPHGPLRRARRRRAEPDDRTGPERGRPTPRSPIWRANSTGSSPTTVRS